jgi:hypothetical protein
MPNAILLGERITVRMWTSVANQAAVNTFHYLVDTLTGTVSDLTTALAFDNLFADTSHGIVTMIGNNVRYCGVQVYLSSRTPMPIPAFSITHANNGIGGAELMPLQSCGITSWMSTFTGPSNRGRTYWPFPAAPFSDADGFPTNTYLTYMESLAGDLSPLVIVGSGGNTADLKHVIKHVNLPTSVDVVSRINRRKFATQKRRGDYGRPNVSPI